MSAVGDFGSILHVPLHFFFFAGFVLAKCGPGPAFVLVPIPPIPQPIPDRYPKVSPLLFLNATSRTLEVIRERQFKEPLGQVAGKGIHAKKKAKKEIKRGNVFLLLSFSFPFLSFPFPVLLPFCLPFPYSQAAILPS